MRDLSTSPAFAEYESSPSTGSLESKYEYHPALLEYESVLEYESEYSSCCTRVRTRVWSSRSRVRTRDRVQDSSTPSLPTGQKFQFCIAPFGLCSSRGFASLALLSPLSHLKGGVYYHVDDILIPAADTETTISRLRNLFSELRRANLSLRANKCVFMDDKADYLGHRITRDGYYMIMKYATEVVRKWGSPSCRPALSR